MSQSIPSMTLRDWWVFLTSPQGRVSRFDYNVKFLMLFFVLGFIAGLIDYAYLGESTMKPGARTYATWFVQLLTLWPGIVMAIKRLHDMDYSGWWLLTGYILPIAVGSGFIGYFSAHGNTMGAIAVGLLMGAFMLTFILILCCAKGTAGPNRFGANTADNYTVIEGTSA